MRLNLHCDHATNHRKHVRFQISTMPEQKPSKNYESQAAVWMKGGDEDPSLKPRTHRYWAARAWLLPWPPHQASLIWAHIKNEGSHVDCADSLMGEDWGEIENRSGKIQKLNELLESWRTFLSIHGGLDHVALSAATSSYATSLSAFKLCLREDGAQPNVPLPSSLPITRPWRC